MCSCLAMELVGIGYSFLLLSLYGIHYLELYQVGDQNLLSATKNPFGDAFRKHL